MFSDIAAENGAKSAEKVRDIISDAMPATNRESARLSTVQMPNLVKFAESQSIGVNNYEFFRDSCNG